MSRVNPPPHLKMPDEFFSDKGKRTYFEQLQFIIFQMWKRTGGGEDAIAAVNQPFPSSQAQFNALSERVGSGDPLTWDETGFTWDSDKLSFDQTEA